MMNVRSRFLHILLPVSIALGGCVVYPEASENQDPECNLHTKQLDLKSVSLDEKEIKGVNSPQAMIVTLAGTAVVGSASAIVSGSVYIVGNTVHWIEKSGTCEDGAIKSAVRSLGESVSAAGGWLVESAGEITDWFQGNLERD